MTDKKKIQESNLDKKFQHLIDGGMDIDLINNLVKNGNTIEDIEDFYNTTINNNHNNTIREIIEKCFPLLVEMVFIPFSKKDLEKNNDIKIKFHKMAMDIMLEKNLTYEHSFNVIGTVLSAVEDTMRNVEGNLAKTKNILLAKVCKKDNFHAVTLRDIDRKMEGK